MDRFRTASAFDKSVLVSPSRIRGGRDSAKFSRTAGSGGLIGGFLENDLDPQILPAGIVNLELLDEADSA